MRARSGREGLQPERTALAWQRTAITATVVMVPLVVVNARLESWFMTILGSVATAAAAVLVTGVARRFAQLRDQHEPFSPFIPMVSVASATGLTTVVAVATAVNLFAR